MNNYIYAIGGAITVLALFENIVPNTKNGKLCKTIIAIISVIMIMSPIINIFKSDLSDNVIETSASYSDFLLSYEENLTATSIKYLLKNNDFIVENVNVKGESINGKFIVKQIKVKLENLVINEKEEHIIISEKIKNLISSRLYIADMELIGE